eukprot:TRINITY_DN16875_c0_g1_i4.p1 TRINITY_DN16875_c0_g1~~TRINITY_DN16875_c0_g1_i4.p1  ORF type:complete len:227 (+),score=44.81 TRINITY_DN16875_c0_g1_i4:49-681(+)
MSVSQEPDYTEALKLQEPGVPKDAENGWRGTLEQKKAAEKQFGIKISDEPGLWDNNAWSTLKSADPGGAASRKCLKNSGAKTLKLGPCCCCINVAGMNAGYTLEYLGGTHYLEYKKGDEELLKVRQMPPSLAYWEILGYVDKNTRVAVQRTQKWGFDELGSKVDIKTMGTKIPDGFFLFTMDEGSTDMDMSYTLQGGPAKLWFRCVDFSP